ncbi:hypothetical protein [Nocardia amamiensis]|uniref:hypothetical protein n=1 Tax=Nocardia amamiensis TaxID=404578 RepID=UPI000B00A2F6|nr:hypothetical protein [Nocardia amamiensis]
MSNERADGHPFHYELPTHSEDVEIRWRCDQSRIRRQHRDHGPAVVLILEAASA